MKKIFALAVVFLLMIGLTACGESDTNENKTNSHQLPNMPSSITPSKSEEKTEQQIYEEILSDFSLGMGSSIELPEDEFE